MYEDDRDEQFRRSLSLSDSTIRKLYEAHLMKPLSQTHTRELSIMIADLQGVARAIENELQDRITRMSTWE